MAGRADHDLHLVEIAAVQAGVLQPDLVQRTGDGLDVLVDRGALLVGAEFRVHVVSLAVILDFDRAGLVLDVVGIVLLGAGPAKFSLVPTIDGLPDCGAVVPVADGVQVLAIRGDGCPVPTAGQPLVFVVHAEIAIHQMVWQAARVVGCELHDAFSVPGRAGRVYRTGGAGQPRAQRGRGDQTGDESCEESHSFFIPSYCF